PPHHHAGYVGVLSSEHRVGRLNAKQNGEGAALLLTCPNCGAPLEPDSGSHVARCKFCQARSFITEEARAMAKGPAKSEPFYLFFSGASSLRREIEEELERAERRRQSDERYQKALAEQRADRPSQKDGSLSWFGRHVGTIAGLSTPFVSLVSAALVFVVLKD